MYSKLLKLHIKRLLLVWKNSTNKRLIRIFIFQIYHVPNLDERWIFRQLVIFGWYTCKSYKNGFWNFTKYWQYQVLKSIQTYNVKYNLYLSMLNFKFWANYETKHNSSMLFEYYLKTKSVAILNNKDFPFLSIFSFTVYMY